MSGSRFDQMSSLMKGFDRLSSLRNMENLAQSLQPMLNTQAAISQKIISSFPASSYAASMNSFSKSLVSNQSLINTSILNIQCLSTQYQSLFPIINKSILMPSINLVSITKNLDLFSTQLSSLARTVGSYDQVIQLQKDGFHEIQYLKPYEKRYFINHETRQQKAIVLGKDDLDNADVIEQNSICTLSFVNSISAIEQHAQTPRIEGIDEDLYSLLARQGKGCIEALEGAKRASRSSNPDKVRQTIASLRELSMHVLHNLSPDDQIKEWSTSPQDFDNGRPTRKCRISYILRNTSTSKVQLYLENEIKFIKDLFEFLNYGTHALATDLNDDDLYYIIYKTESTLLLLLRYSKRN